MGRASGAGSSSPSRVRSPAAPRVSPRPAAAVFKNSRRSERSLMALPPGSDSAGVFDPSGPVHVVRAPGRVNLIGEHIDYCGLPVFPMAIGRSVRLTCQPRANREIRITNRDPRFTPGVFTVSDSIPPAPAGDWSNYARAAAQALAQRFADLHGVDAAVESDLPIAAGLSSSSALLVAM